MKMFNYRLREFKHNKSNLILHYLENSAWENLGMGASVCGHSIAELVAVAGTAPRMNEIEKWVKNGYNIISDAEKNRVSLAPKTVAFHQLNKTKRKQIRKLTDTFPGGRCPDCG